MKKQAPKVLDKAIGAARGAMQVVRSIGRQARPGGRQDLAPLTLRNATEADLPRLIALQLQAQGPAIDDAEAALARWREIEATGGTLWLIEAGPQLLGAAVLHLLPSLGQGGRPLALLADLVVDPHARHRGVTRHLIHALGEQAHAAGAAQLELSMARAGRGRREVLHRLDRVMLPVGAPG